MSQRTYRLKRRAESQQETRQRIVEAAMALHEEAGPRETTISAVARRAGVQRLTVYRHFPDDAALFNACTSHWLALHPPPEVARWSGASSAVERLHEALAALYGYYRETQAMWRATFRDADRVPALAAPLEGFHAHMEAVREDLLQALDAEGPGRPHRSAALGHALRFSTWASLAGEGLDDATMADLMADWIVRPAPRPGAPA